MKSNTDSSKPDKPIKPAPGDCCGGGSCCPCVWDAYREKLREWQAQQHSSDSTPGEQRDISPRVSPKIAPLVGDCG